MSYGATRQTWSTSERPQRRLRVDLPMLYATLALTLIGGLALVSASPAAAGRQLVFALVGLVAAVLVSLTPYGAWRKLAWPLFGLSLALLALVLAVGHTANGAQRWLSLAGFRFQPSELAKLALVVVLARVLAPGVSPRRGVGALACAGAMFVQIALQPDLGTALVLGAICLVMLYVAGVSPIVMLGLVTGGLAAAPYVLKPYQKERLLLFMHPELDPRGMGYSLTQSKTAIGSGGVTGKGWLSGHMTQHGFVPENWTDFLFSAVGEELGLLGCVGWLLLACLLGFCLLRAAARCRDRFGALLVVGVWTMIVFQVLVNIAMTTGMAPVVGIPLPFASYGGSALIVNLVAVGLAGSVSRSGGR